jgi:chromosome partitioning protein
VDLDPQAHASLHLGITPTEGQPSMYEVLMGDASLSEAGQQTSEGLTIVPSHIDLAAAEVELAGEVGRELVLRDRLARAEKAWDFLLVDCPPSLGVLTLNALCAVDEVFLPLQPHFLALHGLSKLLGTIEVVSRRLNDRLKLTGVVLCMYESATRLAAEVSRDVDLFFGQNREPGCPWTDASIFQTRIRRNIRLAEAPSFGQSILRYAPHSHGAEDYRCLSREVRGLPVDELELANTSSRAS